MFGGSNTGFQRMRAVELVIHIGPDGIIADAGTQVKTAAGGFVGYGIIVIGNGNGSIAEEFWRELMVPAQNAHFISPGKIEIKTVGAVETENIVAVVSGKMKPVFFAELETGFPVQVVEIVIRDRVKVFFTFIQFVIAPGKNIEISSAAGN